MKTGPKPRPAADRLREKIKKGPGCWEWQGAVAKNGYGKFQMSSGKFTSAHRAAWVLAKGEPPEGVMVCHRCDNRRCCRISHLFLGTASDNLRDCLAKGRRDIGDFHPNAKLTHKVAATIRKRLAAGETQETLAAAFGVSQTTISNVKRGRVWRA